MPRPVLAALAAILLAGCSAAQPTTSGPTTSGGPGASGGTACQTAPDPGSLPDWQPPTTKPPALPVIVNPDEQVCGKNRLLFLYLDPQSNVLTRPDWKATVAIFDLARDSKKPISTVEATFVWAIQGERGEFIADVTYPEAGIYGAEFTTTGGWSPNTSIRATFSVQATSPTVQVGQKAPAMKTPTATDAGGNLAQISTDQKPDSAFYKISEDAALAKHDPFVLIFATPAFCKSAQCGPTLDRIKPFAAKYPTIDFIHVEPYQLVFQGGQLQPVLDEQGQLQTNPPANTWGLTAEPWVFVVDRTGTVTASLEVIFTDAELTTALDAVK
jgi:hypothetical protein